MYLIYTLVYQAICPKNSEDLQLFNMRKKRAFNRYTDLIAFSLMVRLKLFFKIKYGYPLDYPRQFWIEITNECNLRCIMCPVSVGLKRKTMMMDIDTFVRIIDQICVVRPNIVLHVAGEPLLNKNLFKMIGYAKSRSCSVGICTNATLLTKEMSIRILKSSLDFISFSFDGCTPEVYEKVRVGAKFDKVKSQIETFLKLRHERKAKSPFTQIEIILMKETKTYVLDFIKYWQTKRVDQVAIRLAQTWNGLIDDRRVRKTPNSDHSNHRPCRDIFHKCAILVDGTAVPCCIDIRGRLPLGNILKQPFNEIWNGNPYKLIRKQHLKNSIPENIICNNCPFRWCWSKREQVEQWVLKQIFWRKGTI